MVTDGGYACGKHSITDRVVKLLCYTPETNFHIVCQLEVERERKKEKRRAKGARTKPLTSENIITIYRTAIRNHTDEKVLRT